MANPSYGIDFVAVAVAVVLAAAIVLLTYQVVPDLTDLMMMPPPLSGTTEARRLVLPASLDDPRPVAQRDLVTWPSLHRRPVRLQRDQVVADASNLLDQVLAGRIIPAVNGVGVVRRGAILPDRSTGRVGRERLLLVTPRN